MTNEEMLYEINALPLEAQRHLADFILLYASIINLHPSLILLPHPH